jgi:hypothetical protein
MFVYNKTKPVASALPHSLLDLADPVWRERWADSPDVASRRRGARFGRLEDKDPAPKWARQRANAFSEAAAREFDASALIGAAPNPDLDWLRARADYLVRRDSQWAIVRIERCDNSVFSIR